VDHQRIELTHQKIRDTWTSIAGKHGEDVAQEALCQAFKKAKRGEVKKPLHYAAASARRIAIDEWRRRAYALLYQRALSDTLSKEGAESAEMADAPLITFNARTPRLKKLPRTSLRDDRDPAGQVEAQELLSEVEHDPSGLRLIGHALGQDERISPSQASIAVSS
jgi:DNA-directed RNA polymerase specialized sigma24 family protein